MKRFPLIILSILLTGQLISSYAQTYQVTVDNEPFIFLENAQLAVEGAWSEVVFQVPLEFDFEFFDIISNQLYSAANSLGGYTSLNQNEDNLYMLVHFYTWLIDRGYQLDSALSPIYYKTAGLPGNRVFTIEYNDAGLVNGLEDENGVFLDYINLQTKLYEASGDIEFHYGPHSIQEDPEIIFGPFPGPSIGLLASVENTPGGNFGEIIFLEGNATNPTVVNDTIAFVSWPIPENTVYRFSRMNTNVNEHAFSVQQSFFFPNPTSGEIYLSENFANDIVYPIRIIDGLGKHVTVWNKREEISTDDLVSGSYYVMIHTQKEVVMERLIVLHK